MKNVPLRLALALASIAVTWGTAAMLQSRESDRSIASMALLLIVLAISTAGDRWLAIVASVSAALGFSWFFVDEVGSLMITSMEGALTFSMMMITALAGSHLAIRAEERAAEANRRRGEMEQLHRFGTALLTAGSVGTAGQTIVENLVRQFGLESAILNLPDQSGSFSAGSSSLDIWKISGTRHNLELFGTLPSEEVRSALTNLIDLALDRARTAEQQTQIDATRRGEEFRKTVLSALAHNFRTPLTSIKAAASILRGTLKIPEENARELATVIDEEADGLDQMIRESLDLARIESRPASPRMETCTISEVVQLAKGRISRYLGGRNLELDVPEDLPLLLGDPFLLEQMLVQVLDNAWKYSRPGALIRVSSRTAGSAIFLEVMNEGLQIPLADRERIFAKFYRGSHNMSYVEGTGMGLAISREIAAAHGGTLQLGDNPKGPVFRFVLPSGNMRPAMTPGERNL